MAPREPGLITWREPTGPAAHRWSMAVGQWKVEAEPTSWRVRPVGFERPSWERTTLVQTRRLPAGDGILRRKHAEAARSAAEMLLIPSFRGPGSVRWFAGRPGRESEPGADRSAEPTGVHTRRIVHWSSRNLVRRLVIRRKSCRRKLPTRFRRRMSSHIRPPNCSCGSIDAVGRRRFCSAATRSGSSHWKYRSRKDYRDLKRHSTECGSIRQRKTSASRPEKPSVAVAWEAFPSIHWIGAKLETRCPASEYRLREPANFTDSAWFSKKAGWRTWR